MSRNNPGLSSDMFYSQKINEPQMPRPPNIEHMLSPNIEFNDFRISQQAFTSF